jgi:hypothetical protein
VRHVPGKQHAVADGLSRRPRTGKEEEEEDIDRLIDSKLDVVWVAPS